MRIGELAQRTGVPTKTIRYYEDIGVMPPAVRTSSGYRDFGPDAMSRLQFIRAAQSIGLSLGEIREIVAFRDRGESPCAHVSGLIELHASHLADRIQALEEMRRELTRLAKVARRATSRPGHEAAVCHIIESARPRPA